MAIGTELVDALRSFTRVESDIVAAGRQAEGDIAAELVRARRELVLEFAKLGQALDQDEHLKANPDKMTDVKRLFSAFRSANSINQADWPAIRVRDERESYRTASLPVVERSSAFWGWIERELAFKR